jgi:hypothetical protein
MIKRILFVFIFFVHCGTNTDTPLFPFLFLNLIGTPQIAGVIPTDTSLIPMDNSTVLSAEAIVANPQFILKYYVTNTEQQFVGYNLYITEADPAIIETRVGSAVYLEEGVQPSFKHFITEVSTDSTSIVRKLIKHRVPAPGIVPFQKCEVYTFTLRSVLNNGVLSNPSMFVRGCASRFPSKCQVGKSCNPSSCVNTAQSGTTCATINPSCIVGTDCNPCDTAKAIDPNNGCECKTGSFPPGCNL